MFNQIKWAFQRVVRGYDDRITCSYDSHLLLMMKPLKQSCLEWLGDRDWAEHFTGRKEIYEKTVELIEKWEQRKDGLSFIEENDLQDELCGYIGKHIHWY